MATLRLAASNAPFFDGERAGDVILCAARGDESQRILIGNTSNAVPALTLEGATATVAGTMNSVETRSQLMFSKELRIGMDDPRVTEFSATLVAGSYQSFTLMMEALRARVAALEAATGGGTLPTLYQYMAAQSQYPLTKLLSASQLSAWNIVDAPGLSGSFIQPYTQGGVVYIPDPRSLFMVEETIGSGVTLVFDMAFIDFPIRQYQASMQQYFSVAFDDRPGVDQGSNFYIYTWPLNGTLNQALKLFWDDGTDQAITGSADAWNGTNIIAMVVRPVSGGAAVQFEMYVNGTLSYTYTLNAPATKVFLGLNINQFAPSPLPEMAFYNEQFLLTSAYAVIPQALSQASAQALTNRASYASIVP